MRDREGPLHGVAGAVVLLLLMLAAGSALAFDVPEAKLNEFIATRLADKRLRDLELTSPSLRLSDGYATFCADARPKIYPREISFCAELTPRWRQETATLVATRMSLSSLNVRGIDAQQLEVVKLVMNQGVLPALEGVELYRADTAIAKQITAVKVLPGKLAIELW